MEDERHYVCMQCAHVWESDSGVNTWECEACNDPDIDVYETAEEADSAAQEIADAKGIGF